MGVTWVVSVQVGLSFRAIQQPSMQVMGNRLASECSLSTGPIVRMAATSHRSENVSVTGIRRQVMRPVWEKQALGDTQLFPKA